MRYDPQNGNLHCDHCDSEFPFEKISEVQEREFTDLATFDNLKADEVTCYRCQNCGAVSIASRTALSTVCPYCGSPIVVDDTTGGIVKPDTIIPFELTKEDAAKQLQLWRKHRIFAPRKFRKRIKTDNIMGVFVPAWTFDAKTATGYSGRVGYYRTRVVHENGKTRTETYVQWRHISGVYNMNFDDIVIRANDNIPETYFRKLMPFHQDKYRRYDDEYLAGFIADHYTLEPLDAFEQAKNIMRSDIRRRIVQSYHADVVGNINMDMNIFEKSFKYLLVPVYVTAEKYNKKVYNQYVSGVFSDDEKQKSKVSGKAPISPWKTLVAVLFGVGALALLIWLIWKASEGDVYFEYLNTITQSLLR